jgi:hypothetical protein
MEINPSPSPGSNTNPVGQPLAPNEPLPTPNPPNPSQPPSWGRETIHSLVSTIGLFLTAFSIAIFLNTFVIQSYQVDGQSMEKTLQNDDRLIVNKVPRTLATLQSITLSILAALTPMLAAYTTSMQLKLSVMLILSSKKMNYLCVAIIVVILRILDTLVQLKPTR